MYKLKSKFLAHESDVRTMHVVHPNLIVTGSRDSTCKVFSRQAGSDKFDSIHIATSDRKYVNSCKHFVLEGKNYYVFGTGLSVLYVYGEELNLLYKLEGHSNNVSCMDYCHLKKHMASGSWDCTVKVWDMNSEGKLVTTLDGHKQAVWCVKYVPECSVILSGSADRTIRMWKNHVFMISFIGHTHAVRDIVLLNDKRTFLSCGNDMTIIHWDFINGLMLQTVGQHNSFIYTMTFVGDNEFVSAGEDGELIVWKDMKKFQEIKLPCPSAWKVDTLSDQEIAVACSDGFVRIYTKDENFNGTVIEENQPTPQHANPPSQTDHYKNPSNDKIANAKALEEDLTIPDVSIGLAIPGTKDGQVTLVRNKGTVQVYEWSVSENRWKQFGDVLSDNAAISSVQNASNKIYFEGKEYDYVFPVELEGKGIIRLPYNRGDDEWECARNFIAKHNIAVVYLEQIVNFIKVNAIDNQLSQPKPQNSTYTLHKFIATNMDGLYRKILKITPKVVSEKSVEELKLSADKIINAAKTSQTPLENQCDYSLPVMQSSAWSDLCSAVTEKKDGVDVIPFFDLLRVFCLDYQFTTEFIKSKHHVRLIENFLLNDIEFSPVIVMLILKSFSNMIVIPTTQIHCDFVNFFLECPGSFICFNRVLLWLTKRCHVALSTLMYNFIVYLCKTTNPSGCEQLFHQVVSCVVEGFRLNEYIFEDEALLRLLTTIKVVASFNSLIKLDSDEKSHLKKTIQAYVDRKPKDCEFFHPNQEISSLISQLKNVF